MSKAFDAMFGDTPDVSEPVSEPAAAEPAGEGRMRDEHGRFASASPPAEPAPAVEEQPPPADPPPPPAPVPPVEPGHVPISAMLDEREKRQAATARAEALERQLAEIQARATPAEPQAPEERLQNELYALRDQTQRMSVEVDHGKAAVAEAYKWAFERCETDKAFNAQMAAQIGIIGNPYQVAVEAFRQHTELEEFNAWKASRNAAPAEQVATPTPTPSPTPAPPPPRSLVSAPNGGGKGAQSEIPIGPGAAFASVITR